LLLPSHKKHLFRQTNDSNKWSKYLVSSGNCKTSYYPDV